MAVNAIIDRLGRRYDIDLMRALLSLPLVNGERLTDEDFLRGWCDTLMHLLPGDPTNGLRFEVRLSMVEDEHHVHVRRFQHGVSHETTLDGDFFRTPEYRAISQLAQRLDGLLEADAAIFRGERSAPVRHFGEAIDWLMNEARRGLAIQRYKGLGEMNPEQLWETTMNPDTRRLLQVRIEDAIGADEMFTVLMGDQVEPRRDFIERHALSVTNIDI
jgi:DNA gyrase subunit B